MSTSIDSDSQIEPTTEMAKPYKFGTIDLDTEGVIGTYTFGYAIKGLLPPPKFAFMGMAPETKAKLKFIVTQSESEDPDNKPPIRMYVFENSTLHADLYRQLREAGGSYTLLSAGYLDLTLGEKNAILSGELSQYSESLEEKFQLDRTKSDEYKKGELVKKLGWPFTAR